MSVVITGGLGFIGSHVVNIFYNRGFEVRIIDNLYTGLLSNVDVNKVHIYIGDIRDTHFISKILLGADYVVHLAAIANVNETEKNPIDALSVNSFGTHIILEHAYKLEVEKFVFASSAAVYGEPEHLPIDEKHPIKPKSIYGLSKVIAENIIRWYAENYGIKSVILRYFNVYGPRMRNNDFGPVIARFIIRALKNEPIIIFGDGSQTRDFVYVEDVAEATFFATEKNVSGVFNVGTGIETSILDVAKKIIELSQSKSKIIFRKSRSFDISRSVADISRIKSVLNWWPKYDLKEGLLRTIDWYRARI